MIGVNDLVRAIIGWGLRPAAWLSTWAVHRRLATHRADQAGLRIRYGVGEDTPILRWGPALQARIEAWATTQDAVAWTTTSGSTAEPKRIAFTRDRVRSFTRTSRLGGIRAFAFYGVRRPDLMLLASLKQDDSFTALVLKEPRDMPSWLGGLLDPARYLRHPDIVALAARFGPTATRLWLMAVVDPGLIYSTNPSTLAVFLDELYGDWAGATAVVRGHVNRSPELPLATLDRITRRVGCSGHRARLSSIASAEAPLLFHQAVPGIMGFCCWDGGYVGVFLDRIRTRLPADRYVHVPMYSMSTETLQTLPVPVDGTLHYLPVAPDVLYEFLPADAPDEPARLLGPHELEVGHEYALVASDPYGLRRYQTEDVFRCVGIAMGVPDLRFVRRRGLTWSFTGEKLTAEQVSLAVDRLRADHPDLATLQSTLIPTKEGALPGYRWVLAAAAGDHPLSGDLRELGLAFDAALGQINSEFAGKRSSGRLAPTLVTPVGYEALAVAMDTRTRTAQDRLERAWESQFKLTPLTRRLWEDLSWTV